MHSLYVHFLMYYEKMHQKLLHQKNTIFNSILHELFGSTLRMSESEAGMRPCLFSCAHGV